ncbi:uncharacterized protein LOC143426934 [Xylocopa sonorina]|uniref:uncharacterized protein LOC143426934 n=1 Tax=Xylocopa sonorina TaxID=1818115 RepID=UPI00403A9DAA
MDAVSLERQYLKTTKIFLHLAGIWPDQNKMIKYAIWTFMYIVMVSCFVVEVARVVHIFSIDVIVDESPFISASLVFLLKHANYVFNAAKLKSLLSGMYEDWVVDQSEEEVTIMSKYIARGTFLTMFYLVNSYVCCFLFLQVPWTTRLLEMFKSTNATPTLVYIVPGYYFTEDEYKYYYFIQIHMSLAIILVVIVFVACDTSYTIFVHHACGLMDVTGHRFKYAVKHLPLEAKNSERLVKETYRRIVLSIEAHQRAIAYLKKIEDAHVIYLFICIGLITSCFTITLVKIVTMQICVDFYKYCSFLVVQLMHLFYLMIQGQFVADTTDEIYNTIYEALWYESNTESRILYIVVLRRNLTPPRLTAGGLISMNLQSFMEVLKLSVSYYTVLRSV